MFTQKKYDELKIKYGNYSSWAVWDNNIEKDTSIISKNIDVLHSKFVFIGLNISTPLINGFWSNFHGGRHDRKLKYALNDNKLRGSYLTDIFKGIPESQSVKLKKILNEKDIRNNVKLFYNEMMDVETDKNTKLVVFGRLAAGYFEKYFRQSFKNSVVYYDHYSAYNKYSDKEWVTGLWEKLDITQNFDLTILKYK